MKMDSVCKSLFLLKYFLNLLYLVTSALMIFDKFSGLFQSTKPSDLKRTDLIATNAPLSTMWSIGHGHQKRSQT